MSTLATWDKISGALGSTTSTFGGQWGNLISDFMNGIDVGLTDPTKLPRPNTLTRFKNEKLGMFDGDESHHVLFSVNDIDTGSTRKIVIRRMVSPNETDYMVMENLTQTLTAKSLDFSQNTATNIPTSAISDNAITQVKMADNSVGTAEIIDANVTLAKLATASVNSDKIVNDSIVDTDIGAHTSTKITITNKAQLNSVIAYEDDANVFTNSQKISHNGLTQITLYKPINTQFTQWGIDFNANDSASAEATYAKIWASLEDNTAASKDSYIGFSYSVNNAFSRRFFVGGNGIGIGTSGTQLIFNNIGLTEDRTWTAPDENGTFVGVTNTQILTNKTLTSPTINGTVTTVGGGIVLSRTAATSSAEILQQWKVSDDSTSYIMVDNASSLDNEFIPRITSYGASNTNGPGLYLYSNIATANDTGNTNAVIVLDSRRANATALTTRPILDVRNFGTNLFRVFPDHTYLYRYTHIIPQSGSADYENLLEFTVSDAPSCFARIQNGSNTNTVFTPLITSSNAAAAATAGHVGFHIRTTVLTANDTGAIPINMIEARQSGAITTRPILGIRNYDTDEFLFGPTYFDMTGNELRNATIASTVTGIVDANIGAHTSTKITITNKSQLNSNILYSDVSNSLGANYLDITRMAAPGNPSVNNARFSVEQIDTDNDGVFCLIKKAGSFVKVQIL